MVKPKLKKAAKSKPEKVDEQSLKDSVPYCELYMKYVGTIGVLARTTCAVPIQGPVVEEIDRCMHDAKAFLKGRVDILGNKGRWQLDVRFDR